MIKMIIEMNEEKIGLSEEYTVDKIYATLDRIFIKNGMERIDTVRGMEYVFHELSTDFARFGKIMLGLKEQKWFMDNVKTWLYCSNDESEEFNEEDLLVHYGKKVA